MGKVVAEFTGKIARVSRESSPKIIGSVASEKEEDAWAWLSPFCQLVENSWGTELSLVDSKNAYDTLPQETIWIVLGNLVYLVRLLSDDDNSNVADPTFRCGEKPWTLQYRQ